LRAHLKKAAADIIAAIPDPFFRGLAVIDYEHWRPVHALNWHSRVGYFCQKK
jgi:hyaluronoglucosaminidase